MRRVNILMETLTEELSARLVESKLDTFEFSLDGVIPEVVDKIRKTEVF